MRDAIAGLAVLEGDSLWLRGEILRPDGSQAIAGERRGASQDGAALGRALAEELLERAPAGFLAGHQVGSGAPDLTNLSSGLYIGLIHPSEPGPLSKSADPALKQALNAALSGPRKRVRPVDLPDGRRFWLKRVERMGLILSPGARWTTASSARSG